MIGPSVYGQAIIILVYVPLLTFTGVEGKMFEPMALTVILALVVSVHPVSDLCARPDRACSSRDRVTENDNAFIGWLKAAYAPLLGSTITRPLPVIAFSVGTFAVALLLFVRLGQEFIPTLDEKNIAMHALRIPSTSLRQAQTMQFDVEKKISSLAASCVCIL